MNDRIIRTVSVPVISCLNRVFGDEPSDTRIVVPMSEEHQPAVRVRLVLRSADESEGSGSRPCSTHRHPEGVVEDRIGRALASVCDPSRRAERVLVRELADGSAPFRESRSVGRRPSLRTALATSVPSQT